MTLRIVHSLCLAADLLSSHFVVIFLLIIAGRTTLGVCVTMSLSELSQLTCLFTIVHIFIGSLLLAAEDRLELTDLFGSDGLRELYFKIDKQVAEVEALLVERHTEPDASHHAVGLDHSAWFVLNSNLAAIQVLDREVNTSQSLMKANLLLDH